MSRKNFVNNIDEDLEKMKNGILDGKIKRIKRQRLHALLGLILGAIGCALCIYWFSWKLLLVLFILQFASNSSDVNK